MGAHSAILFGVILLTALGCQALSCMDLHPSVFKTSCKGFTGVDCPEGSTREEEVTPAHTTQCFCVRDWTLEEAKMKAACACDSFINACLSDGKAYEYSCTAAKRECQKEVVSEACNNITDHATDTYNNLCKEVVYEDDFLIIDIIPED